MCECHLLRSVIASGAFNILDEVVFMRVGCDSFVLNQLNIPGNY